MSANQQLVTKMSGALQLADSATITSASGVLTLTSDTNCFIAEGTEAITSIVGGMDVTQGVYVITWNTARTLTYNATSLILIGKADRTTAVGDVGLYQLKSGVVTELFYSPVAGYAPATFRGVSYDLSTTQSIAAGATTKVIMDGKGYDTDNFWSSTQTRIEIPSGVSWVRILGSINWQTDSTTSVSSRGAIVYKNGVGCFSTFTPKSGAAMIHQVNNPPIPVTAGDYFELYAYNGDTVANTVYAYLSMEVIE